MKGTKSKHDRLNLCKQCRNKRKRERRLTDDRYYLRTRFKSIKQRCYDLGYQNYHYYGGRGITVCQEWLDDPGSFIDWALTSGWRRDLQIDRIDNDGPYSPDNCRWVTPSVQNRNKRNNVTDFEKGTRICERCGIEKPLEEFNRDKYQPEGRTYICKSRQCRKVKA